tara:strand:- start:2204 stop:3001 length:798 start_codon:yes stop_codon:yes gene_type:complete
MNQEMTSAVSALPASKRWQFLDLKDHMTQNILSEFNDMTGGMSGLMEGVLNNMLKLDDYTDKKGSQKKGLLTEALESAFNGTSKGDGEKAKPRVPICASEDAIAAVIHSNQERIEETNSNILDGMDTFIGDMMNEMNNVGGASAGISSILSKLGNIRANMTSALDFENIKQNVFPFELPPNEAVADYYTFCGGGASQSQSQLPSAAAIQDAVVELKDRIIPDKEPILAFAEPPKNADDVILGDNPSFTQDEIDAAVADESEFNMF